MRLKIATINYQYFITNLFWKSGDLNTTIQHAKKVLALIDDIDENVENKDLLNKMQEIKDLRLPVTSDLAYYYAQRYSELMLEDDISLAVNTIEELPKYIETLTGIEKTIIIDNYLFVIYTLKNVDKHHKERFVQLFESNYESLKNYLSGINDENTLNLINNYGDFAKQIKDSPIK